MAIALAPNKAALPGPVNSFDVVGIGLTWSPVRAVLRKLETVVDHGKVAIATLGPMLLDSPVKTLARFVAYEHDAHLLQRHARTRLDLRRHHGAGFVEAGHVPCLRLSDTPHDQRGRDIMTGAFGDVEITVCDLVEDIKGPTVGENEVSAALNDRISRDARDKNVSVNPLLNRVFGAYLPALFAESSFENDGAGETANAS